MRRNGVQIPQQILENVRGYLENNLDKFTTPTERTDLLWALTLLESQKVAEVTAQIEKDIDALKLPGLLRYARSISQYRMPPAELVDRIRIQLKSFQNQENEYYWNENSYRAEFALLLMDMFRFPSSDLTKIRAEVDPIVLELARTDYRSYYISTYEKRTVFTAFARYIEVFGPPKNLQILLFDIAGKQIETVNTPFETIART